MSLPLDTTGISNQNIVTGEITVLTPLVLKDYGYVFPTNAPFFGRDFAAIFTDTSTNVNVTRTFVRGVDYDFALELRGFGNTPDQKVWGAIIIHNTNLVGNLSISYRALGGSWTINRAQITQYSAATFYDGNTQTIALRPFPDIYLPNNPTTPIPLESPTTVILAQAEIAGPISLGIVYIDNDTNQEPGVGTGSSVGIAADGGQLSHVTNFPQVQPVSGTLNVNIANAGPIAKDSTSILLLNAVKDAKSISTTVWVDVSLTPIRYYIRRESYIQATDTFVINWETVDGSLAQPNINAIVPVAAQTSIQDYSRTYTAIADGPTNTYNTGDQLVHFFGINLSTTPATVAFDFWFNTGPSAEGGRVLTTAPNVATYGPVNQPITGSVQVLNVPTGVPDGVRTVAVQNFLIDTSAAALSTIFNGNTSAIMVTAQQDCWIKLGFSSENSGMGPIATVGGPGCVLIPANATSRPHLLQGATIVSVVGTSMTPGYLNLIEMR